MAKAGFVKNTVMGRRRGKPWPQETRTACIAELVAGADIHHVAQRYGVPESTMRGWLDEIDGMDAETRKKMWSEARIKVLEDIAMRAAGGARLGVEMINRRLEVGDANAKRACEIEDDLLAYDFEDEDRRALEEELRRRQGRVVSDYPLANFTRTLMSVGGMAAPPEDDAAKPIRVTLAGEVAQYAE